MATETASTDLTRLRDPQKTLALLFGAVLVVLGTVDFVDVAGTDDRLLGVFAIPPLVNLVHVLTGLLGLFLGRYAGGGTLFNKLGWVIYLVVFLAGVVADLAGSEGINRATNGLHLLLAIAVGAVGFGIGEPSPR